MIAAMMVATLSANAQNEVGQWSIKPMAGVNLASMTKGEDTKMRVGLAVGAELAVAAANNFEVSAGVLYSMQGVKEKWQILGASETVTYKFDYINIPILANLYVTRGLALKAGIQPGFNVSKKVSASGGSTDVDDVKGFAFSVPVGLSYEFSGVVIDARYNWGLTKVVKDADPKHSVFTITLGYKIPF